MKNTDRIEMLLDEAYTTDDVQEMERLAREVLKLGEDNVEALILLADAIEYSDEKIELLEKAKKALTEEVENLRITDGESFLDDDAGMLYVAVLQRLGFALFSEGKNEEALEISKEIQRYDPERETLARTLYYRVLLEMKKDGEILEETLKDEEKTPAMMHSRAIAAFRISGPCRAAYNALWDAFAIGPDIPFYILGYYDAPVDESEEVEEDYNFALLFEDIWSSCTELINWLASATILLGLTASLFTSEHMEKMMILADALGIAEFAENAMVKMESREDWGLLSQKEKIIASIALFSEFEFLPLEK